MFHASKYSGGCPLTQVFLLVLSPFMFSPTGMCCALNSEVTFKDTLFGSLVTEAQGEETAKRKVKASSGLRAGVSLVLDMHSNRASFGTIADTSSAFSVFIGSPTKFPVLREDKVAIEPGKEHFLKLSGQVSWRFKDGELKAFSSRWFQHLASSTLTQSPANASSRTRATWSCTPTMPTPTAGVPHLSK